MTLAQGKDSMITIKVVWESTGKPVKDSRVVVWLSGFSGGVSNEEYTDDNGEAHFDIAPAHGEIYVDGSTKYKGLISGRKVIYI
jgi:hypothetical protein